MSDLLPVERRLLEAQIEALRADLDRAHATQRQDDDQRVKTAHYHDSQVRFRTVFEHSLAGHLILDADLTIRQANTVATDLLGLESAFELVGHDVLEYIHPSHYINWNHLQQALWAHHTPNFSVETRLLRPDGTLRWCRVTCVLFPDDGKELGYTTLEDISERKQLETQVQHNAFALQMANEELRVINEELQETNTVLGHVNAELNTFVYAASHDLRTPIRNLQGLVLALTTDLSADAQQLAQVGPILGMMQQSMTQFEHTLNRMTDFGIVQSEEQLQESLKLDVILQEVQQELAPLLAATQGQVVADLAGNSTLWFVPKHVHSVLFNLISNALKYRHPARAPYVSVRSYRESDYLVVQVKDNGLGLNQTQQRQLFHLFRRLHTHVEGTGVGLYLVKKILENAGGSIRVESELDKGSTFTAIFPVHALRGRK